MQDDEKEADLTVVKFEEDGSTYELVLPHASRDHIQRSLLQTKRPYELLMLQDMARAVDKRIRLSNSSTARGRSSRGDKSCSPGAKLL